MILKNTLNFHFSYFCRVAYNTKKEKFQRSILKFKMLLEEKDHAIKL